MKMNKEKHLPLSSAGKKVVRISKEQRYNRCKYSAQGGENKINNRKVEKMYDLIWDIIIDMIDDPDQSGAPTRYQ